MSPWLGAEVVIALRVKEHWLLGDAGRQVLAVGGADCGLALLSGWGYWRQLLLLLVLIIILLQFVIYRHAHAVQSEASEVSAEANLLGFGWSCGHAGRSGTSFELPA